MMTQTSIVLATADVNSERARKCIEAIKKHTADYELIIINENVGAASFPWFFSATSNLRVLRKTPFEAWNGIRELYESLPN
jgi:hypothetical protein